MLFGQRARRHGVRDALLEGFRELAQRLLGDLAFVNVDQHARKPVGRAACVEFALAVRLHPDVFAVRTADPVFGPVPLAGLGGLHAQTMRLLEIVRMNHVAGHGPRDALHGLLGGDGEGAGKAFVAGERVGFDVPYPGAEYGTGVERQLQTFVGFAQCGFGTLPRAFREHPPGGLDHDRDHAGRRAAVVGHGAVVQIHPHVFGLAVAQQHEFLVTVRQRAAGEARVHDVAVERGHFRPAQLDRATEQVRMPAASEFRVSVVVDHVSLLAPQHHERQGRAEYKLHGGDQTLLPSVDRAQFSRAPVERPDAFGHFPFPTGTAMVVCREWHCSAPRLSSR